MNIYSKLISNDNRLKIRIFGHVVYSKKLQEKNEISKVSNIFENIFWDMHVLSQVSSLHSVYSKYKRMYENRDVVLVATGPTASEYINPISTAIHIGINNAPLKFTNIDFDAVFMQDAFITNRKLNADIYNYKLGKCKKFFGIHSPHRLSINISKGMKIDRIPQHFFYDTENVIPYLLTDSCGVKFAVNLECEPFGDIGGTVFSALQFICYTHPRRIFIVGCDCNSTQSSSLESLQDYSKQIEMWKYCMKFIASIYPEIEIISVNPVGLQDICRDVYSRNYIEKNPDINSQYPEILEEIIGV